jgi:hypothetical protein
MNTFVPGLKFQADLSPPADLSVAGLFRLDNLSRASGSNDRHPSGNGSRRSSKTEGRTCASEEIEGGLSALGDEDSS